jgi:hypothetical protein
VISLRLPVAGVVPLLPGDCWEPFRQAQGPELAEGLVIAAASGERSSFTPRRRLRTPDKSAQAGTIQLASRFICLVFGRCASLFGAYVFGFNMLAPHASHTDPIRDAFELAPN